MEFERFKVTKNDADRRFDRAVRKFLADTPLSLIHKSIRNGTVRINGEKKEASYRLRENDCLEAAVFLLNGTKKSEEKKRGMPPLCTSSFPNPLFTDVFVNADIRIVNKAYGVPVHGGNRHLPSADALVKKEYFESPERAADSPSLSFVPGALHRIDRNTTGLVAFSQSLRGAQWFTAALAGQHIQKEYIALLQGKAPENGLWEHRVVRSSAQITADVPSRPPCAFKTVRAVPLSAVKADDAAVSAAADGKIARTRVQSLASVFVADAGGEVTLARICIETGRTHQIRAQSAFCGFPLLGDTAYGARRFRFPDTKDGFSLFLHAHKLVFSTDNPLHLPPSVQAPLPEFFRQFIQKYLPAFDLSPYTQNNEIL